MLNILSERNKLLILLKGKDQTKPRETGAREWLTKHENVAWTHIPNA
jgi:hypothetical protein